MNDRRQFRLTPAGEGRRTRRRAIPFALVALAAIACTSVVSVNEAGALLQPFRLSPSSGPPGTVVGVSGTGCTAVPDGSAMHNHMKITSATLPISVDIPVGAGGAWNGRFTVPRNALGLWDLVAATCFPNGGPSTTAYSPQTFTVTGTAATPTTPSTQRPVGTPAPTPGAGAGGAPPHPAVLSAPVGNGNGSGSGPGTADAKGGAPAAAAAATKLAAVSGAGKAFAVGASSRSQHRMWLWWVVFALVVLAAASALLWRLHRNETDVATVPPAR